MTRGAEPQEVPTSGIEFAMPLMRGLKFVRAKSKELFTRLHNRSLNFLTYAKKNYISQYVLFSTWKGDDLAESGQIKANECATSKPFGKYFHEFLPTPSFYFHTA
jgi:hypothetical protein